MRFLFLGTGTSGGVPIIACDCATCTSDDPRDNRTRTGAAIQWTDDGGQDRLLLLDATPDLRVQALRHDLRRCDAILFTHNHVDHIFGLDEVRRFNAVMPRTREGRFTPIGVYAEPRTMEHLTRVFKHIFDAQENINDSFVATLEQRFLTPGEPVDLHGLRCTPIRLMHGRLPIVGFRIEAAPGSGLEADWLPLAYCTDVSEIPGESRPHLEGLATLVLDGLRWKPHPTHLTIEQAVETAASIGAQSTWLVHIAHQVKHSDGEARTPDAVHLAWDGLTLGTD